MSQIPLDQIAAFNHMYAGLLSTRVKLKEEVDNALASGKLNPKIEAALGLRMMEVSPLNLLNLSDLGAIDLSPSLGPITKYQ